MKTSKGKEANLSPPWDDRVSEVGEEIKKALAIAGSEIEKAFKTAKEGIRKATTKESVFCSKCGATNRTEAQFCPKCGLGGDSGSLY